MFRKICRSLLYAQTTQADGESRSTVRNAIYRSHDKIPSHSNSEMMFWAVQNGLIDGMGRQNEGPSRSTHLASGSVPPVTSGGQKVYCAKRNIRVFKGPSPVGESVARTTWVQGLSHAATRIQTDSEHPVRRFEPCPCSVVVTLWKWPEKCRPNAPSLAATTRGR